MKNTIIKFENSDMVVVDGMPCLMIHVQEDEKEVTRYLYPFRGYSFQVCGTIDGQLDLGRSEVIGLGNVYNATNRGVRCGWGYQSNVMWGSYEAAAAAMGGFIYKAIMRFANRYPFITQDYDVDTLDNFSLVCTAWVAKKMNDSDELSEIIKDYRITDQMKQLISELK